MSESRPKEAIPTGVSGKVEISNTSISYACGMYQDKHGCYHGLVKYVAVKKNENGSYSHGNERLTTRGESDLVLNGNGESKLAKKVNRFLHFHFEKAKHPPRPLDPLYRTVKHKKKKTRGKKYKSFR